MSEYYLKKMSLLNQKKFHWKAMVSVLVTSATALIGAIVNSKLIKSNKKKTLVSSLPWIVVNSTGQEIEERLGYLDKSDIHEVSKIITCQGNNIVHLVAKKNDINVLKSTAKFFNEETYNLSKQLNSKGKLPLELADDLTMRVHLLGYASKHNIADFTQLIQPDDVYRNYLNLDKKSQRYKNLELSIIAANKTRKIINKTATHPVTNTWDESHYEAMDKSVNEMRDRVSQERLWCWFSDEKRRQIGIKNIIEFRAGNCGEYAELTLDILQQMKTNTPIEIYYIEPKTSSIETGTHVINVIGRRVGSHPTDFTTWGDDAVVCDAQSGHVFFAKEIPEKLKGWVIFTYTSQNKKIYHNIHTFFNPKVHQLRLIYKANSEPLDFHDEKGAPTKPN